MNWWKCTVERLKQFLTNIGGSDYEKYEEAHPTPQKCIYYGSPFVHTRESTMFLDEYGISANEFWEQVWKCTKCPSSSKTKCSECRFILVKVDESNLTAQHVIPLPFPSLKHDFPQVLCCASTL
eukprot:Sdes_comp15055_c0_seq1m3834